MPISLLQHEHKHHHIKHTTSLCPVCRAQITAEVYERDNKVYLYKTCEEHGTFDVLINSDRRWYFDSIGADGGCCAGTACCSSVQGHNPATTDKASTCIALIEIVTSCNLACPTCYAGSPHVPDHVEALTADKVHSRINAVIKRKGFLDILQLSGGEPTLHPNFIELLDWAIQHESIGYILLNTNGVRLARDDTFMQQLAALHDAHKGFELYLQYDGEQEAAQQALRGADLRAMRQQVIQRAADAGIPVTLAMTVNPHNLPHLGDTLRFALKHCAVRGITFQPEFYSGRTTTLSVNGNTTSPRHLNTADIISAIIAQ